MLFCVFLYLVLSAMLSVFFLKTTAVDLVN